MDIERIGPIRKTEMRRADGSVRQHEDRWDEDSQFLDIDYYWTGHTEFQVLEEGGDPNEQEKAAEKEVEEDKEEAEAPRDRGMLRRRRARTRQLQRGLWVVEGDEEVKERLQATLRLMDERGVQDWISLEKGSDLFEAWASAESAQADVQLILCSRKARRMRKPQPFSGPAEVPLRKGFLLLETGVLCTYWETWTQLAPQAQIRPLVAAGRQLYLVLFGKELGEQVEEEKDDRYMAREQERMRRWNALPRELKLAVKRIHVNLGHANIPSMLRALRVSRASEVALRAVRLFRCEDCPRIQDPKQPRPSKLPIAEEFNVQIGMDIIQEKDSSGHTWSWLNILCQGTSFQICVLLGDVHHNPSGKDILEAFVTGWTTWAGYPERGLVTDRAKPFLAEVAEDVAEHGCTFDSAAKAAPWQIGQIERRGGLWKGTFRRAAWSQQASGLDEVRILTASVNHSKNTMCRKHGFSPSQWVLGKDLRLPADLADDSEVSRIGAQALADTPGTKFFRKTQLRMAAREAFARTANSDALRRAELRKVRPTRGPFLPGMYVWYYDQADRAPGPNNWRGVARVIGKEGQSTIWISHRGILLAVAPEHLSRAFDEEVRNWTVVAREHELVDASPAAGGTSFIDLRKAPAPGPAALPIPEEGEEAAVEEPPAEEEILQEQTEDLSASSTSMGRMHLESERERKRELRSSEFFSKKQEERRQQREEKRRRIEEGGPAPAAPMEEVITPDLGGEAEGPEMEFDPELDDYHQSRPTRQLSPLVEDPEAVSAEREAKRLRTTSHDGALQSSEGPFAHMVLEVPQFLEERARSYYSQHADFYKKRKVNEEAFLFGVKRNDFTEKYEALAAQEEPTGTSGGALTKKKGRKELKLTDLKPEQQRLFTGQGGSDAREWDAWISKEACTVLDYQTSKRIRKEKPDLIVPTRWVRTNKSEGLIGKDFQAKSRLVVQGFKDKSLGFYRRDAPTASAVAESIVLTVSAFHRFVLVAKDIKNAYFSGKSVGREIYLDPPRGGLPGVGQGQLLQANKAIYGFAEAARLFWLALREHLLSDGWVESRLEPALFYLRRNGVLKGILVTHVDDIEGGLHPSVMDEAFRRSSLALEFATNHVREFIFRGREIKQHENGNIDVSMKNYALSMRNLKIEKARRSQLEEKLDEEEMETLQSSAGELGWLARQLRCDLGYENGVLQRSKVGACVADLLQLKKFVGQARRGADFRMKYWSDINIRDGVVVHLADSGHANGTPDRGHTRYRSVGGYFILIAEKGILEGEESRCNILSFHSGVTKRVCRSTLAAEASHLAEAVEAGDWIIVLLEEALSGEVDLKNWQEVIERRQRVYVTDARSVYDYLQKDATSTSTDKRMAIEGALLRETVRRHGASVRWIDGMQNIADVLTKENAEKDTLREFMRTGRLSLVQTEANKQIKEKKRMERQKRRVKQSDDKEDVNQQLRRERQKKLAEKLKGEEVSEEEDE